MTDIDYKGRLGSKEVTAARKSKCLLDIDYQSIYQGSQGSKEVEVDDRHRLPEQT